MGESTKGTKSELVEAFARSRLRLLGPSISFFVAVERVTASLRLLLEDFAALHHELHASERLDVFERVAFNRDDVRKLARLDRAELLVHPEQLRRAGGGGAD